MKSTRRKIILLSLIMTIASLNTVAFAGTANRNDDEFLAEKIELAEQKLSKMEIGADSLVDGKYEKIIELGDDCYVKVTLEDVAEEPYGAKPTANAPAISTLWKGYGSRKFTATYEVTMAEHMYKMSLCNHYTLSAKGVSVRYSERWLYEDGREVSGGGAVYTTNTSAKVGETAAMNCPFTLKRLGRTCRLYNNVRCVQIDNSNQRVKVTQSWKCAWE